MQIALKDLTPPQVTFILPANGETEVTDKPTIVIGFNEPMDASSLNSATVTIKTANGSPAVGSYEYDSVQNVLSIAIVERLYLNTQYAITVTEKVKDRAGNTIAPMSSSFTTDLCPKSIAQRPVFNGKINFIAKISCTLYLGGEFLRVANALAYGIPLGEDGRVTAGFQYNDINGKVHAVVSDGAGGWYIAGEFTRVGNMERYRLAHVAANGEILPLNPRIEGGDVLTLILVDDTLYLGGTFTHVNGVARNRLAAIRTNGYLLSWNPAANSTVLTLYVSGNTVYLGGAFSTIGGNTRNRLAAISIDNTCLTTYTPSCLKSWNPNANNLVRALAVSGSTVYAGGDFTSINSTSRNRLAAISTDGALLPWNPGASDKVHALQASGKTIHLGGDFTSLGGYTAGRIGSVNSDGSRNW